MITTIPFSGFYESIHSYEIDTAEEGLFQDDRGNATELSAHFCWLPNYREVHAKYAKHYAENFGAHFEIALKFESLSSPREYNFATDRIFCEIPRKEVRRLYREVDKGKLAELAKKRFTSCSGFISHYSPDVEDWGTVDKWDHNQIGTLIEAFTGRVNELDMIEDINSNGDLDNWIISSVPEKDKPEMNRLFRIHDYLRHRQERNRVWYYQQQGQQLLTLS